MTKHQKIKGLLEKAIMLVEELDCSLDNVPFVKIQINNYIGSAMECLGAENLAKEEDEGFIIGPGQFVEEENVNDVLTKYISALFVDPLVPTELAYHLPFVYAKYINSGDSLFKELEDSRVRGSCNDIPAPVTHFSRIYETVVKIKGFVDGETLETCEALEKFLLELWDEEHGLHKETT